MTSDNSMTYLLFMLVCLMLLTAPFVPALREWLKPTDITALRVLPDYSNDIDHFARRLHADVQARLGTGPSTGFEDFSIVTAPSAKLDWAGSTRRLLAKFDIDVAHPINCIQPLYVQGSVKAGADSAFTALYATGDIELGPRSMLKDWAHADGTLRINGYGAALRRISAGQAIELGHETWFERLQAPSLRFGNLTRHNTALEPPTRIAANLADLPNVIVQAPDVYMVRGDCNLPAGRSYVGSLIVTGFLVIGKGSALAGSIKAREGVSIGTGCEILGAITCDTRIYVFARATVMGPIVSESDILIGAGAQIGSLSAPTTVTAENIIVETGVEMHGAVWAHDIGMVKAP